MEWIKLFNNLDEGLSSILMNESILLKIKGEEICLFLTKTGFWAIENRCPHRDLPLQGSKCIDNILTCTFHFLPINIRTGLSLRQDLSPVKTYAVQVREDGVFIEV